MKKQPYTQKRPLAEINVVPYIDVMLVLLVIFMITAPLLTQGIHVSLPHASTSALAPQKALPIVVSVDHQGFYYLNLSDHPEQPISETDLLNRAAALLQVAKQEHKIRAVFVKGDQYVNYGKVVQAMALLQKAGADSIGLITAPLPQ